MELINFAAWLANQETVTGSQVDVNTVGLSTLDYASNTESDDNLDASLIYIEVNP
jgi:hypothetical protein